MAAITIVISGNWNSTTPNNPWPSGTKPISTDTVVIPSGMTLTQDDAAATCAGISGAGTLAIPATTGLYTLTCTGNISCTNVTGGTSETPLSAGVDFQFILNNTNGKFTTNGVRIYGAPLAAIGSNLIGVVEIAADAINGATTIYGKGDLTTWKTYLSGLAAGRGYIWITKLSLKNQSTTANARRQIDSAHIGAYDAGNDRTAITIPALTEAKESGGHIILETRNVCMTSNVNTYFVDSRNGAIATYCEFRNTGASRSGRGFSGCSNCNATGSTFINLTIGGSIAGINNNLTSTTNICTQSVYTGFGHNVQNSIFSGSDYPIYFGNGHNFSGSLFTGNGYVNYNATNILINNATIVGNNFCLYLSNNFYVSNTTFSNNALCMFQGSANFVNCTFTSNTVDIRSVLDTKMYNCTSNSVTKMQFHISEKPVLSSGWRCIHYNAQGTANRIESQTEGGYTLFDPTNTVDGTVHPLYGNTHKMVGENTTYSNYNFYDTQQLTILPNETWSGIIWVKNITTHAVMPKVQLINTLNDPFINTSASALWEDDIVDNGSDIAVAEWQMFYPSYTNSTAAPIYACLRALYKDDTSAAGTMYVGFLDNKMRTYSAAGGVGIGNPYLL